MTRLKKGKKKSINCALRRNTLTRLYVRAVTLFLVILRFLEVHQTQILQTERVSAALGAIFYLTS